MNCKAILDEHIGTPPPSTVDIDRIIRRERRGRLMRRLGAGGAAAAVTALAITASVALTGATRPSPSQVAAPDSVASAQPSPSASQQGFRFPQTGDGKAILSAREYLQTALEQALIEVAPDAAWIYMPDVPGETPLPDGHPKVWAENGAKVGFAARSGLSRNGAKAGFYLRLRHDGCSPSGIGSVCTTMLDCHTAQPAAACTSSTTPDGRLVVEITDTPGTKGGKAYRFYIVQVKLLNGYFLSLDAVNYFGGDGSGVSSPEPMLSKTELKTMALSIADQLSG